MSASSSARETHLLAVGKQCSAPLCNLVDFLPFKCQHCEESFCAEHFKVEGHKCPKYDETKFNRVAPNCPLCNEPIAIRPGQDPNIRMDEHISNECSVMTGKASKSKSTPVCARPKCGKVLFAPIQCDKCKLQFCPSHRFPTDHNCNKATAAPSKSAGQTVGVNLSAKANAASAAIRRAAASTTTPSSGSTHLRPTPPPKASPSSSKSSSSSPLPFSKTDRSISSKSTRTKSDDVIDLTGSDSDIIDLTKPDIVVDNTVIDLTESSPNSPTKLPLKYKPDPVIDPMSFAPPSVFASA